MTERFGKCPVCEGHGCGSCEEEGFWGGAFPPDPLYLEYLKRRKKVDMSENHITVKNKLNEVAALDVSQVMEKVIMAGDLAKMQPQERVTYYLKTCESLGMNPMTKPFDLITLNGKMILYPNRAGGDQLRKIGNVSIEIVKQGYDRDTGCYEVIAQAKLPNGRTDEDMGAVACSNLKGDAMANAKLKAVTKAKRRVTLSIMGLGWVDESEVGSIKGAQLHKMDLDTGDVIHTSAVEVKPAAASHDDAELEAKKKRDLLFSKLVETKDKYQYSDDEIKKIIFEEYHVDSSKRLTNDEIIELTQSLSDFEKSK